ncbi:MAG: phosphonate metabolism protein/1,5-bisphosphokinase (PRPP-forming) PhnN [Pseudomonadota bacterium]|jgi:phosphonate metabolism protein PhnN/1,5-bisphosphokinase (PRPP-forming)
MIAAIVGPSGAGKDTLINAACRLRPDLRLVRRVITRPSGAGGEDFEGVTEDEFERRRALGDFALCWQAHALSYGIPKVQLLGPGTILFNGSRAILSEALRNFPGLRVILVTAPDAVLARRLSARGRETEADIAARLERAGFSLPDGIIAETVVNDGTIEAGASALLAALQPVRA